MKKFFLSILIVIILGGICGYVIYKKYYKKDMAVSSVLSKQVYAFQIGVFDEIDNAKKLKDKYGGIIVPDNTKYRVYIALASSSNVLTILKEYYDDLDLSYYVKQIEVDDELLELIKTSEDLLIATTKDNYDSIINNVLKEYEKKLT